MELPWLLTDVASPRPGWVEPFPGQEALDCIRKLTMLGCVNKPACSVPPWFQSPTPDPSLASLMMDLEVYTR